MTAAQKYRKELLQERRRVQELVTAVRRTLVGFDSEAQSLPYEAAAASHRLVKQLWEALPDESEALHFGSVADLAAQGAALIQPWLPEAVTLHLGWDYMAYRTTLFAAWSARPAYGQLNSVTTFNCCIYPESLNWYVICAGPNLYAMRCDAGPHPVLVRS